MISSMHKEEAHEMNMLELKKLSKNFGGLKAVDDFDLTVQEGEIHGLIGPNGAGKSTVFNVISGFLPPSGGQVLFQGRDITGLKPHVIAKMGLLRTFQEPTVFKEFTTSENIETAQFLQHQEHDIGHVLGTPRAKVDIKDAMRETEQLIHDLGLDGVKDVIVNNLPYGQLRLIQFALCRAGKPMLFLLDEPFTGMNSEEIANFAILIRALKKTGATIVVIEHNMRVVMSLCDIITVLNFGEKIAEGPPQHIQNNELVIQAYLGSDHLL